MHPKANTFAAEWHSLATVNVPPREMPRACTPALVLSGIDGRLDALVDNKNHNRLTNVEQPNWGRLRNDSRSIDPSGNVFRIGFTGVGLRGEGMKI